MDRRSSRNDSMKETERKHTALKLLKQQQSNDVKSKDMFSSKTAFQNNAANTILS